MGAAEEGTGVEAAVPEGGEELDRWLVGGVGLERSGPLLARAVGACLARAAGQGEQGCARAGEVGRGGGGVWYHVSVAYSQLGSSGSSAVTCSWLVQLPLLFSVPFRHKYTTVNTKPKRWNLAISAC